MNYVHGKTHVMLAVGILSLFNLINFIFLHIYYSDLLNTFSALCLYTDENEERSMVEPASLENPKVKDLQEVV